MRVAPATAAPTIGTVRGGRLGGQLLALVRVLPVVDDLQPVDQVLGYLHRPGDGTRLPSASTPSARCSRARNLPGGALSSGSSPGGRPTASPTMVGQTLTVSSSASFWSRIPLGHLRGGDHDQEPVDGLAVVVGEIAVVRYDGVLVERRSVAGQSELVVVAGAGGEVGPVASTRGGCRTRSRCRRRSGRPSSP